MMFKLILLAFFIALVRSESKYCDPNYCSRGLKHIACESSGSFAPTCPKDRSLVNVTRTVIQKILDHHNKLRSRIANGDEVGFKPAARMATMVKF